LTKDDFQVFEDGKLQTISAFSLVDIPIERLERPLFAAQPIEPDVRSNAQPFDGRIYIMVLDDWHVQPLHSVRVREAARRFIEQKLGANDLMAVIHVGARAEDSQEFTSNKRLLVAAADRFVGKAERSVTLERYQQYLATSGVRQFGDAVRDPLEWKRGFDARATLEELRAIADWFGGIRGRRKTILLISEGIEYDIYDVFEKRDASIIMDRTRELIRSATRSNVSIYAIDPRGLTDLADQSIELQSPGAEAQGDPALADIGSRGLRNELRLQHESLRTFAEETGGFAVINTNSFATAYARIVEENSSYYVLAYYPPNPKRDGRFHTIQVRVNRPGLTVRARRGYAAPTGRAPAGAVPVGSRISAETRAALDSPLPVSGLTLQVFAAAFKGVAPNASVLLGVEMAGKDLRLAAGDKLQITYYAIDAKGKSRGGSTDTFTVNFRPETKAIVEQTGIRALGRLQIPPGRYQLRVAANDLGTGRVGSVLYDLDVPDFTKPAIAMSGLVLTSASASRLPTVRPDEELRQLMPASPAGSRVFAPSDEIALFAEVYDNTPATPHKVDITTTITSDEGKVMLKTEEVRDSADLQGKPGGYGFATRIPLTGLPHGIYVLRVEGRSRLGNGPSADRQVQFRIAELAAPLDVSASDVKDAKDAKVMQPIRTVDKGSQSEVTVARQVSARDATEWDTLWRAHAPTRARPAVDFSQEMVVGVFLGSRPTAGFAVEIVGYREDGANVIVEYREAVPGRDLITAQVLTSPYHLVVVPRWSGMVVFQKVRG
jgi:VWFA-related protein